MASMQPGVPVQVAVGNGIGEWRENGVFEYRVWFCLGSGDLHVLRFADPLKAMAKYEEMSGMSPPCRYIHVVAVVNPPHFENSLLCGEAASHTACVIGTAVDFVSRNTTLLCEWPIDWLMTDPIVPVPK